MLLKQHLKELAEKILPGLAKQRQRKEEEGRQTKWFIEQRHKCEAGEEIEPPWIFAPNEEPWWGGWKQGIGEVWLLDIWLPFWQSLTAKQRTNYLEKWQPPTEDWNEYLTVHWINK